MVGIESDFSNDATDGLARESGGRCQFLPHYNTRHPVGAIYNLAELNSDYIFKGDDDITYRDPLSNVSSGIGANLYSSESLPI